jgi:tripartite-type tricarboxylate transporter receptor subunit TctC
MKLVCGTQQRLAVASVALASLVAVTSFAQTYPSKPIRLIVPAARGRRTGSRRRGWCWGGDGARPPGLWHGILRPLVIAIVAVASLFEPLAGAQTYPSKPIRLIVPTAPGGGTDLIARVLAQSLNEALGQPVVVDNRGGAGTTLGTALTAKSPPDGYTIMLHHVSLAFNATFYRKLPYDTLKDLAPIGLVATQPFLVVAHPSLPVKSVRELVALAKARPGEIAYGTGGAGSGPYMGAELLKQAAHIDILHVPYKGAGPAFTDLMGGQVQMMVATISLALPHARSGRVRALAVTSPKRVPVAPELPTVAESGVPGYEFAVWYGLLAPGGTPQAIVTRLNAETAKILQAPDIRQKFAGDGLDTLASSPEAFAAHLKHEVEKWANVVNAAGIHAN